MAVWNAWLEQRMFICVVSALLPGLFIPMPFVPALRTLAIGLFAYMTFVTALNTTVRELRGVLTRPWTVLWILFLVHVIVPLLVLGIGWLSFPHDPYMRLGFLIEVFVPIGATSIIWTSVVQGDVALALVAVTLDTLVTPLVLPVSIALVAGPVHIDYAFMLLGLLWMVTIPSLAGVAVNHVTRGRLAGFTHAGGGLTAKAALFGVVFINAAAIGPKIKWDLSLVRMLVVIFLLVVTGYLMGWAGSRLLKSRRPDTAAAVVFNVGMRNISFGSVLAVAYFPVAVAVPVTLAMLYQQPLAAVTSYLLTRSRHKTEAAAHSPT